MNTNQVIKINFAGPAGIEIYLVIDFAARQASLLRIEPTTGNIRVTDV